MIIYFFQLIFLHVLYSQPPPQNLIGAGLFKVEAEMAHIPETSQFCSS